MCEYRKGTIIIFVSLKTEGPGIQPHQVPLVSNNPSQFDDGRVACDPGRGPVGVVNATPLQCCGEGGAEIVLRQNVPVVVVRGESDVVLLGKLLQILKRRGGGGGGGGRRIMLV